MELDITFAYFAFNACFCVFALNYWYLFKRTVRLYNFFLRNRSHAEPAKHLEPLAQRAAEDNIAPEVKMYRLG